MEITPLSPFQLDFMKQLWYWSYSSSADLQYQPGGTFIFAKHTSMTALSASSIRTYHLIMKSFDFLENEQLTFTLRVVSTVDGGRITVLWSPSEIRFTISRRYSPTARDCWGKISLKRRLLEHLGKAPLRPAVINFEISIGSHNQHSKKHASVLLPKVLTNITAFSTVWTKMKPLTD